MKVLKSGKRTMDSLWYGECNECGAIVSAKGNELTNITKGDYRSDNEDFAWEECPYCKTMKGWLEKVSKGFDMMERIDNQGWGYSMENQEACF